MDGQKPRVAAIVPAFNEEETIGPILETLKTSPLVDEVILISDASSDRTHEIGNRAGITISHQLPIKGGKGAAMAHGVAHTDAPIIFFADADLYGFSHAHIEAILKPVIQGRLAMCVGLRDRGKFLMKLSGILPLIGGERAMRRQVFEDIPDAYRRGFMAEIAMNYYCRSRKLKYGSAECPGLTIRRKMQKVGFTNGLREYIRMYYEIFKAMIIVRWAHLVGKF
ncbi:MAG: glycosyltransferase family 2 protein [Patescibacteria group bacterium]|nr:glycosyltransferase family 2 protein [Patescibacteria group bacterium]